MAWFRRRPAVNSSCASMDVRFLGGASGVEGTGDCTAFP
ncbi:hypothetical protein ANMWB30_04510 [Arthrobacter sp. MWB30]|nr:hypothetical protein ANMWB30_04510 [Arthrobacter sp. MWB30]